MSGLATEFVTSKAATESTKQTTVLLSHWWCHRVEVGSAGIAGLWCGLWHRRCSLLSLLIVHLVLVRLILRKGVSLALTLIAALLLWAAWVPAIVAGVALWVGGIVSAILSTLLTVLEAAMLRWTEGVLSSWWTEVLRAVAALLLLAIALRWVRRGVVVSALLSVSLLLSVALLLAVALIVLLAVALIVRSGHICVKMEFEF